MFIVLLVVLRWIIGECGSTKAISRRLTPEELEKEIEIKGIICIPSTQQVDVPFIQK